MALRPNQNVVGICRQINVLTLYELSSTGRLVILLIYSSIQVSDFVVLTLCCKFINLFFQIFFPFVPVDILYCSDYIHLFGLNAVTIGI
jgi:hypothetical protein